MNKPVNFSVLCLMLIGACTTVSHEDATDTWTTQPPVPPSQTVLAPVPPSETPPAVPPSQTVLAPVPPSETPDSSDYVAQGNASLYGIAAHGTKTASGQIYDLYGMTAAHASLPLLARVKVKNIRTGDSVVVTINDRLDDERVLIKLSYWTARRIGLDKNSSQAVEVRGLNK
ncbi:MAG: septal ring lytic transglycosylase RlpA family protein [Pseudomonadota bacterium]